MPDDTLHALCRRMLEAGGSHPNAADIYADELDALLAPIELPRLAAAWRQVLGDQVARGQKGRPAAVAIATCYRQRGTTGPPTIRPDIKCVRRCRDGEVIIEWPDRTESVVACSCGAGQQRRAAYAAVYGEITVEQVEARGGVARGRVVAAPPPDGSPVLSLLGGGRQSS